jgi:hypothetical protein
VTRCDFTCFSNQTYPNVVLELFIKEAHFSIRILGIMLHGIVINSFSSSTKTSGDSEYLLSGSLLVSFLLFLRELFKDFDLRWLYLLL